MQPSGRFANRPYNSSLRQTGALGGSWLGLLAIESDQICCDRLGAELAQHRRDLAAVIAAMIDQMLEHLPVPFRRWCSGEGLVFDNLRQILGRQANHVGL